MVRRRVVVTGMGVVASQFLTLDDLWNTLISGTTAVRPFDGSGLISLAVPAAFEGNIEDFQSRDNAQQKSIKKGLKVMSCEIQMALAASCRALNSADIQIGQFPSERIGISFGSDYILTTADDVIDGIRSCMTGSATHSAFDFSRWGSDGLPKMPPLWQLKYLPNMPASHIAILNQFFGPSNSITLREASIGAVVGESVEIIGSNRADIMLVGTTGSRLHPFKMLHAYQQDELTKTACRPFDQRRDGTVLGEGSGALVLEDREHAERRGATIFAEIVCGSYRAMFSKGISDHRRVIRRVLECVLQRSGMLPEEIGHINAHGLGSRTLDQAEASAIYDVFGDRPIPATAAKGCLGNLGAGSGAVELIAGILALRRGVLFPTRNFSIPDPDCPVSPVQNSSTLPGNSFIKIAFNPQAQASAILVKN